MKVVDSYRLDKSVLTVTSLSDDSDEKEYWSHKSPAERWQAIESMRQIIYGYDPFTSRLQRVLTVTHLSDIWVATDAENVERVIAALADFGFTEVEPQVFTEEKQALRMGVPPLRIELLTGVSGVEFEDCYPQRTVANLGGVEVSLISLEHLKANKAASGRYKDLNDLEHLS